MPITEEQIRVISNKFNPTTWIDCHCALKIDESIKHLVHSVSLCYELHLQWCNGDICRQKAYLRFLLCSQEIMGKQRENMLMEANELKNGWVRLMEL